MGNTTTGMGRATTSGARPAATRVGLRARCLVGAVGGCVLLTSCGDDELSVEDAAMVWEAAQRATVAAMDEVGGSPGADAEGNDLIDAEAPCDSGTAHFRGTFDADDADAWSYVLRFEACVIDDVTLDGELRGDGRDDEGGVLTGTASVTGSLVLGGSLSGTCDISGTGSVELVLGAERNTGVAIPLTGTVCGHDAAAVAGAL